MKVYGHPAEERVDAEHILERTAREKELLLKPQFLADGDFIVRI
jgi:hypothetical protein